MKKSIKIALLIGIVILIAAVSGIGNFQNLSTSVTPSIRPTNVTTTASITSFSYKGKDGIDALRLLQKKTTVGMEKSGLVTEIAGRKADNKKREFWAFYVNGNMAQVGPKEYITKDSDKIDWKIEKY